MGMPPNSNVETGFGMPRDVRLMLAGPSKTKNTKENSYKSIHIHVTSIR